MTPPSLPISAEDADLGSFVIEQGLTSTGGPDFAAGICERLLAMGVPLWRFFIAVPLLSPELRAITVRWQAGLGVEAEQVRHDVDPKVFEESPFAAMIRDDVSLRRWRLGADGPPSGYPVLETLRQQGATDYIAHLVSFDPTGKLAMRGAAIAFTSDAPEGFSDAEIARLARLVPLVGLAIFRIASSALLKDMLGCYVGRDAGERVLRGEIRRGEGHRLSAALLFADLRGFTGVAERSGERLVARLGEHLAAMAEPVESHGGQVLKFLGDGLLAAFAVEGSADSGAACAAATSAALAALERNAAVNARHPGEPPLDLDVALHRGEVFYGNVGGGSRLDFTVIGPAVNEASRIEHLCGALGEPLLMSAAFAECCGKPIRSLGLHALRGVREPREIFALAARV